VFNQQEVTKAPAPDVAQDNGRATEAATRPSLDGLRRSPYPLVASGATGNSTEMKEATGARDHA